MLLDESIGLNLELTFTYNLNVTLFSMDKAKFLDRASYIYFAVGSYPRFALVSLLF